MKSFNVSKQDILIAENDYLRTRVLTYCICQWAKRRGFLDEPEIVSSISEICMNIVNHGSKKVIEALEVLRDDKNNSDKKIINLTQEICSTMTKGKSKEECSEGLKD